MAQGSVVRGRVTIATNNGDIGGGEVMLLSIARACARLGVEVTIVGPSQPSALVDAARAEGFSTVVLEADNRRAWMRSLRHWDARERTGVLWCNGLVPAMATAGHANRIVHLHSAVSRVRRPIAAVARRGALTTLVPSTSMLRSAPRAAVFANWVPAPNAVRREERPADEFVVGFLGRPSVDKGVPVLAGAMQMLEDTAPGRFRLLLAGEPRLVAEQDQATVEDALAQLTGRVDRPGWISPDELFARVDLLVCPSIAAESFGLVAAEAMAARVPLLVSDAGALPEVVAHDVSAVVPAGDSAALAAAILRRSNEPSGIASVEAGYARWAAEFSPDAGLERTRRVLTTLGVL